MHSNGKLYATDNGPNLGYGRMMTNCNGGSIIDTPEYDKINLIEKGKYYGYPNHIRGKKDKKQCIWHSIDEQSTNEYTAPLIKMLPSTDGIIEWQTNHFDGQLRYNLITSKYSGPLYRIILNSEGTNVIEASKPAIQLVGSQGLDVTQGPDGTLIELRYGLSQIWYHKPIETKNFIKDRKINILSIYPRRGNQVGGQLITIYGTNFFGKLNIQFGKNINNCLIQSTTTTKIICKIPGSIPGQVDVIITSDTTGSTTYANGFRYIKGVQ